MPIPAFVLPSLIGLDVMIDFGGFRIMGCQI